MQRVLDVAVGIVADYGMLLLLAVLVIIGVLVSPNFFTKSNLLGVLSESAPIGITALGETFVIIAAGFDLSVGATFSIGATLFAQVAPHHSWYAAGALAVVVGLLLGAINGFVVTRLKVNAFIATFGTGSIFTGAILLYTHDNPYLLNGGFTTLGGGQVASIPIAVLVLVAFFLVGALLLARTVYGRNVYAIGGNDEASRLAGVRVMLIRSSTYVLCGGLSAFAGIMQASRLGEGQGDMGATNALTAIAIVVIGGTALLGGEGAVWRTAVGLLIIGTLTNIFFSLTINPNWQTLVTGAILIAAVAIDQLVRKGRRAG